MKLKRLILIAGLLASVNGYATQYIVYNTQISIMTEGRDSEAHHINAENGIYNGGDHPWCGRRAYIDFADWELFAAALAASIRKKPINFGYEDSGPPKSAIGHGVSRCRVFTIF